MTVERLPRPVYPGRSNPCAGWDRWGFSAPDETSEPRLWRKRVECMRDAVLTEAQCEDCRSQERESHQSARALKARRDDSQSQPRGRR